MWGIDMNGFYMFININQDGILYAFENKKWLRRTNPNPNFPNLLIQISYFSLFNFSQIKDMNNLSNKLIHIFIFSEYYT